MHKVSIIYALAFFSALTAAPLHATQTYYNEYIAYRKSLSSDNASLSTRKKSFAQSVKDHFEAHGGYTAERKLFYKIYGTQEGMSSCSVVSATTMPSLYAKIATIAKFFGITHPLTLVIPSDRIAASAKSYSQRTGTIILHSRLLRAQNDFALEGMLAHEMGHILHRHGTVELLAHYLLAPALGIAVAYLLQKKLLPLVGLKHLSVNKPGIVNRLLTTLGALGAGLISAKGLWGNLAQPFYERFSEWQADGEAANVNPEALFAALHNLRNPHKKMMHERNVHTLLNSTWQKEEGPATRWYDDHPALHERINYMAQRVRANI